MVRRDLYPGNDALGQEIEGSNQSQRRLRTRTRRKPEQKENQNQK
jgi:hypothetical protein